MKCSPFPKMPARAIDISYIWIQSLNSYMIQSNILQIHNFLDDYYVMLSGWGTCERDHSACFGGTTDAILA